MKSFNWRNWNYHANSQQYTTLPLGMVLRVVDGIIVAISAIAFPP